MKNLSPEILNKVKRIEITAKQSVLDLFSGMYHSIFKGRGLEIEDLREFQPGDDIRSVSWSKTAQMGRPYVKNFREERDLTVVLLVDISGSMSFRSHFENKREKLAELGALLAFSAIYNHDKVSLILFSSEVEKYVPPKRGLKHGVRLIRELLAFEPVHKKTNLNTALEFLNRVLRRRAICFVLSDFYVENFEKPFLFTAKKNDLIAVRMIDPEEVALPYVGLVTFQDLETGRVVLVDSNRELTEALKTQEEKKMLEMHRLIGKSGASLLELDTITAIRPALQNYFKARRKFFS